MIPLLTPEAVKDGSSRQGRELAGRVRDLYDEENRLVNSINKLREEERAEKKRVAEESEKDQATIAVRKTVLVREVESLESRKEQALKPARLVEEEARKVLADNVAYGLVLDGRAVELKTSQDKATEKLEEIHDRKQLLDEREAKLDTREVGIAAAEAEVSRSTLALGDRWVAYDAAVAVSNEREVALALREAAADVCVKANDIRAEALDRKDAEQAERERGIVDGYAALEAARREILEGKLTPE
jgi:hypothetical protein